MQVEEIIARAINLSEGCGFTIEGEHVFCDDQRLDNFLEDGHRRTLRCATCECKATSAAIIAALDAAGFVIVPKEPTPAILKASGVALKCFIDALPNEAKLSEKDRFGGYWLHRDMKAAVRYRAMLAARPDASERGK